MEKSTGVQPQPVRPPLAQALVHEIETRRSKWEISSFGAKQFNYTCIYISQYQFVRFQHLGACN